ncbi:MAG: GDSL-type esterase/lipase family protein [Bryobacterales bacterium]|nr:GDSL-type esterase/lipase family protein [Bryobacterales bacterium]
MIAPLALGLLAVTGTLCAQTGRIAALERTVEAQRKLIRDWGGLIRYGSANAELGRPKPGERRVVFFGDDATEHWGKGGSEFFPGRPYVNRGIAGQSTPQLLVRFRQDVVALKPKAVVIQGGMHDISGRAVPGTRGMIAEHVESMVDIAERNGIRVIVASLLPVCECGSPLAPYLPRGQIFGVNDWLEEFADQRGLVYLNYYPALALGRNFNHKLTDDGVVPNAAGYAVMALMAEEAIRLALEGRDGSGPRSTAQAP